MFLGKYMPSKCGQGPSALQFGGFPVFMPTPFDVEWPNLAW